VRASPAYAAEGRWRLRRLATLARVQGIVPAVKSIPVKPSAFIPFMSFMSAFGEALRSCRVVDL
jgi:hypothetical protein